MWTKIEDLGKVKTVTADQPLPVKYVNEKISRDRLYGRLIGLIAEISKRSDEPIEVPSGVAIDDDMITQAYTRVVDLVTMEEARVINALAQEVKWAAANLGVSRLPSRARGALASRGWKGDVRTVMDNGGNMYDLLEFTSREYLSDPCRKGFCGQLRQDGLGVYHDKDGYGFVSPDHLPQSSALNRVVARMELPGRGWLVIDSHGMYGAVNERGEGLFLSEYDDLVPCYGAGYMVKSKGKWGYVNISNALTIDYIYDEMVPTGQGRCQGFWARIEDEWTYLAENGQDCQRSPETVAPIAAPAIAAPEAMAEVLAQAMAHGIERGWLRGNECLQRRCAPMPWDFGCFESQLADCIDGEQAFVRVPRYDLLTVAVLVTICCPDQQWGQYGCPESLCRNGSMFEAAELLGPALAEVFTALIKHKGGRQIFEKIRKMYHVGGIDLILEKNSDVDASM